MDQIFTLPVTSHTSFLSFPLAYVQKWYGKDSRPTIEGKQQVNRNLELCFT